MNKNYGGMKLYMPIIAISLAAIGIIFSSFLDMHFTHGIYIGKNVWSEIIEYGGTIFTAAVIGSAGILLGLFFKNRNQEKDKIWMWLSYILGVVIAGGYWGFDTFHRHTELGLISKPYIYLLIGFAVIGILDYLIYLFAKNGDTKTYSRKAIVIIIATALVLVFSFAIKVIVARPRYMWIHSIKREDLFLPWFNASFDKSLYKEIMGDNYISYNIESFPSGHASFAYLTALSILLCSCNKKTEGKEKWVFIISLIWSILVMLGRLLDGHHYVSDVSFGLLISATFIYLTMFCAYREKIAKPQQDK